MAVRRISLGPHGFDVSAQGLGCMSMSKPEADMINLIRHAVSIGVTHLDTSDVYGPHTNEVLVGMALREVPRDKVQIATKFGCRMVAGSLEVSGHPDYVKEACEASLKRLGVDFIDLYYVHRIDKTIPIEVTMGALKQLVEEEKVKHIGLSEASPDTIRRAHARCSSHYSNSAGMVLVDSRCQGPTYSDLPLGIVIVPYRPLGKGFFASGAKVIESNGFRENVPKFNPDNVEHNNKLYDQVSVIAARKGCTTSQLALAWLHHQGDDVCPIPGTTKMENLESNIKALSVQLTAEDMSELEAIATPDAVKGDRYSAAGMARTWMFANTPPLSSWKASE